MGRNAIGKTQPADKSLPGTNAPGKFFQNLFISFFMSVLSQSFFTLVRRNFMTLSFFTTRHTS
jgi:hypothetical protein